MYINIYVYKIYYFERVYRYFYWYIARTKGWNSPVVSILPYELNNSYIDRAIMYGRFTFQSI